MPERVRRLRQEAAERPDDFWAEQADGLPWFRRWDRVFDWEPPTFRWFVGGETNLAGNCLDANVEAGRGERTALAQWTSAAADFRSRMESC
jgi:acetyl-CoA synthetase